MFLCHHEMQPTMNVPVKIAGEYPWQVAILKKEQYDHVYVCGGSLIDGSHLLTAAHCITQYRSVQFIHIVKHM